MLKHSKEFRNAQSINSLYLDYVIAWVVRDPAVETELACRHNEIRELFVGVMMEVPGEFVVQ